MGSPVTHFQFMAGDGARLERFYADAFGWTIRPVQLTNAAESVLGTYRWIETGSDEGISGGIAEEESHRGLVLGIEVDDLEATLARVEALGGQIVGRPFEMGVSGEPAGNRKFRFASFLDPEGNPVGLTQPRTAR